MPAARLYQRKWLLIRLPIALVALAAMAFAWVRWMPLPPASLTISSGLPEGVYNAYALRYQEIFAEQGVTLVVAPSQGTGHNLQRLAGAAQPQADLAFVQGGVRRPPDTQAVRLVTIAKVDVEPLWIFTRVAGLDSVQQFKGLRVSLGPPASGSRALGTALLEQVRLTNKDITDSELSGAAAVRAMAQGNLDALMMVSAPDSPIVQTLMEVPGVQLAQLRRSSALIERMPYLEARLLPQGTLGSRSHLPPRDTTVLATSASLVARADLHPALQRMAARAAQDIHSTGSLFRQAGEFPSLKRVEYSASDEARRTFAHGLPWFEAYLPFWPGQILLRVLVICLPIALVALWLARVIPAYLRWLVESRIARWYGELKYIEFEIARPSVTGLDLARYRERLDDIEQRMKEVVTPSYLMPRWFLLREHVDFVRSRLLRHRAR